MTNDVNGNRIMDVRWWKLDENMWMLLKKAPWRSVLSAGFHVWLQMGDLRSPATLGQLAHSMHARNQRAAGSKQGGRLLPLLRVLILRLRVARTLLSAWRFFSFTNSFSCARVCFCDQDSSKLVAADHLNSYWQQQLREILILSCEESLIT